MKAKTYQSDNNFTVPKSLSNFGIPIRLKGHVKYLGLEEFNFCKILRDFKFNNYYLAYIPCYSTCSRPTLDKLDLFLVLEMELPFTTQHYLMLNNYLLRKLVN